MTAIEKTVLKVISGFGFLPTSDQQGLLQTVRFLASVFGSSPNRSADHARGISLIQEGVFGLLPHLLTGGLSRSILSRKIDLVISAAEKLDPEFVRRMKGEI